MAVLTPIQWAAMVAAVGLGFAAVYWMNRKQGVAAPRVTVHGFSAEAGYVGTRRLKVTNNAVTWIDEDDPETDEETGCIVPLDASLGYNGDDGRVYFADVSSGKVFKPDPEKSPNETVTGRVLFQHAKTQEAEKWAAAKEAGLFKLARYAPWAFGVIIAFLAVLAYGMFGQ